MLRQIFSFMLSATMLLGIGSVQADEPDGPAPFTKKQQRIRRAMNNFKKAPQPEVALRAEAQLLREGLSREEIKQILQWDASLLDPNPLTRLKASKHLAESTSLARVGGIGNLRRLIAAEANEELLWQHAVTLSSIDPQSGSALDIIRRTPFDPVLRQTLRFPEIDMEKVLIAQGNQRKNQEPFGATVSGPFISGNRISWPPEAPPPPQKIPAHPLIAKQEFGVILEQAETGSSEALKLLELYWKDFPQTAMAEKYVPLAFDILHPDHEQALRILNHAGPDAELVMALETAEFNQSLAHPEKTVAKYVEILNRMNPPGPYSQVALKQWRNAHHPPVRMAVIRAMNRSPEMQEILLETLRDSLINQAPAMKQAAFETLTHLEIENPVTNAWLEEQLLTTDNINRLLDVAAELKSSPGSLEFQEKVLQRIREEKSPMVQITLIDYLRNQAVPNSEKHQKLSDLKKAILTAERMQLADDLRVMIEESRGIKKQIQQEAIKQLEELNELIKD